jgi:superfamily II DNA/RNA helicase
MEFLRFVKEGYKEFEKLMIFSATIGNAEEFKENLQNALGMRCCLISGEPVRGRKTVYVVDLSDLNEDKQENLVDKVLKEYCKKAREKTIVFARNKREAEDYYYEKLLKKWRVKKYVKAVLHIGDMPMSERELATSSVLIVNIHLHFPSLNFSVVHNQNAGGWDRYRRCFKNYPLWTSTIH